MLSREPTANWVAVAYLPSRLRPQTLSSLAWLMPMPINPSPHIRRLQKSEHVQFQQHEGKVHLSVLVCDGPERVLTSGQEGDDVVFTHCGSLGFPFASSLSS